MISKSEEERKEERKEEKKKGKRKGPSRQPKICVTHATSQFITITPGRREKGCRTGKGRKRTRDKLSKSAA